MASGANFDAQVFASRRFGLKVIAATALHGDFLVFWMGIGFHRKWPSIRG
jgi:hypothetical protein